MTKRVKQDERTENEKEADKALAKKFASWHGWDIAKELGLDYDGDSNPIEHGGCFYNHHDWQTWGYADCIDVYRLCDDLQETTYFTRGTIHKIDGMPTKEERIDPNNIDEEIQACRGYAGIETDHFEEESARRFPEANWPKEWRIWLQMLPALRQLAIG